MLTFTAAIEEINELVGKDGPEDEPRDEKGKWTSGGGESSTAAERVAATNARHAEWLQSQGLLSDSQKPKNRTLATGESKKGKIALVSSSTGVVNPETHMTGWKPSYAVYVYTGNYSGQHRGGMRYSWKVAAKDLTQAEAEKIFNRRLIKKADDKSTKAEASYQSVPNGGDQCADCTMYVVPSRCTAVEGYIAPHGWCKFYERKQVAKAEDKTMMEKMREALYGFFVKNHAADIAAIVLPDVAAKHADGDVEKLKLKHKVSLEADPDEIKALTEALQGNPGLKSAFEQALAGVTTNVSKATRTIRLIRHGATRLNNESDTSTDRIRGWKNVPLTDEGRADVEKMAEKLADKDPVDNIVSSDLKRASDTAKIVAKACGIELKDDDVSQAYRPWDVGKFAGQASKTAVPILCDYAINKPDEKIPEGSTSPGESFNSFKKRFTGGLVDALDKYPNGVLGVVAHHRNDRLLAGLEAADWDGTIDGKSFTKKGESTASYRDIEVPVAKLRKIAEQDVTKWVNRPEDLRKIWEEGGAVEKVWAFIRGPEAGYHESPELGSKDEAQEWIDDETAMHEKGGEKITDSGILDKPSVKKGNGMDEFDPDTETFDSAGSSDRAYDWAMKRLRQIEKLAPGVADVHAPTALGNERRRRRRKPISAITETHPKVEEGSVDKVEWDGTFKVSKTDPDQQLVFGWASVSHIDGELVIDKQDDVITSEELEKAAYDFVLYCREQGDMHVRKGVGKLVESTVFTAEKAENCGLFAVDVSTGEQLFGWWTGFKVSEPGVWKRIKAGILPEFSIGGRAVRVPLHA